MKTYMSAILIVMLMKLIGTMSELLLPYILEYLIDEIVPRQEFLQIAFWGLLMVVGACL